MASSLIANYINAEELQKFHARWRIYTANPELVLIKKIETLSYNEANY
jgi:aspartokinase/homoserine dehydrogenase 1